MGYQIGFYIGIYNRVLKNFQNFLGKLHENNQSINDKSSEKNIFEKCRMWTYSVILGVKVFFGVGYRRRPCSIAYPVEFCCEDTGPYSRIDSYR